MYAQQVDLRSNARWKARREVSVRRAGLRRVNNDLYRGLVDGRAPVVGNSEADAKTIPG